MANGLRTDIQALRGIAVLLVVIYHADFGLVRAGYLGVDVFFVISGFLITGLICRDLDTDSFSFVNFYKRRARRLLPAALVVFAATSAAACFLLTAIELQSYAEQVLGAVTFTANFVLASQASYFDTSAALKPLLHTWSLSVEEQFYFIAPLALWLTPRRFRIQLVAAVLFASMAACFTTRIRPEWAFFMLPTRAWELAIGSMIATARVPRLPRGTRAGALCALLAVAILPISKTHPGADTLIACIATAILIAERPGFLNSGLIADGLAKVGVISYSLYLVHWPIFAFTRTIYFGELPLRQALLGMAASFVLAFALYRWIEAPFHYGRFRLPMPLVAGIATASLVVMAPVGYAAATRGEIDWTEVRQPNVGLADYCDMIPPLKSCMTQPKPEIAVWGDSFAMHLVDGLIALDKDGRGILQLTRSACAPVLTAQPSDDETMKSCVKFNKAALAYIKQSSVKYVALSAAGRYDRIEPSLRALRDAGKVVVFIGPPPESRTDKSICVERRAYFIRPADCAIKHSDLVKVYAKHIRQVAEFERDGYRVIWIDKALCVNGICRTHDNGVPIYRDTSHLSTFGSAEVAKRLDLLNQIVSSVRNASQ